MELERNLGAQGTPQTVIAKLNAAIIDALADAKVHQRLADVGQEIFPREAADAGGAPPLPEIRDREMVADHDGGRYQGGVNQSGEKELQL